MWLASDGAGRCARSSIGAAVTVGKLRPVFLGSHSDTDALEKAPGEAWKNLKQTSVQPRVPKASPSQLAGLPSRLFPFMLLFIWQKIRQVTCQVRDQQVFCHSSGLGASIWDSWHPCRAIPYVQLSVADRCPLCHIWGNTIIKVFLVVFPSSYASLAIPTGVGYRVHRPQSRFHANRVDY